MAELNLPFGVYRSTRGDLDLKFRVISNAARDSLITNDLVEEGHIIYNEETSRHEYLKTYPTFGSLTGIEWEKLGSDATIIDAHSTRTDNPHSVDKTQVGLGNVDNTSDLNKPVSTATQSEIDSHKNNTSNPHSVTKSQVGLSNVDNTSDANKPVSGAQQTAIDLHGNRIDNPHSVDKTQVGLGNVNNTSDSDKPVSTATQAAIDAHENRTDNPHSVTKSQVGLGNVDNTSDLNKPVSTATSAAISSHSTRTDNPHSVTKSQVGLGNVDNTSDSSKPVSTATQAALDLKFDKTGGTLSGDVSITGNLTVTGNMTQVNGQINAEDSVVKLNDNEVGAGVTLGYSGFEIDRGTSDNFWFGYDEVRDRFTVGKINALSSVEIASTLVLATRDDSLPNNSLVKWDDTAKKFVATGTLATDLDNIAYTNINNNYTSAQTHSANVTVTNGTGFITENTGATQRWQMLNVGTDWRLRDITGSTYPIAIKAGVPSDSFVLNSDGSSNLGSHLTVNGDIDVKNITADKFLITLPSSDTAIIEGSNDAQLRIKSNSTSWSGIGFNDSSANEGFLFYNGSGNGYFQITKKLNLLQGSDITGVVEISPNTPGKNTFQFGTEAVDQGRLKIYNDTTESIRLLAGGDSFFTHQVGFGGIQSPTTPIHVEGIIQTTDGSGNATFYGTNSNGSYARVFGNETYSWVDASGTSIATLQSSGNFNTNGSVTATDFIGTWNGETKSQILNNVAFENVTNTFSSYQIISSTSANKLRLIRTDNNSNINILFQGSSINKHLGYSNGELYSANSNSLNTGDLIYHSGNFVAGTNYQAPLSNVAFTNVSNTFTGNQIVDGYLNSNKFEVLTSSSGGVGINLETDDLLGNGNNAPFLRWANTSNSWRIRLGASGDLEYYNTSTSKNFRITQGGDVYATDFIGTWNGDTADVSATNNTIVKRNSSGYIYADYYYSDGLKIDTTNIAGFAVRNSANDGFIYGASLNEVKTALGLTSLDAATLDGIDSSQFARVDSSNTFDGNITLYDSSGTYSHELFFENDTNKMGIDFSNSQKLRFIDRVADTSRIEFTMSTGAAEFDGTVTANGGNSINWNTAFSWGDHAGLYALAGDENIIDNATSIWNADGDGDVFHYNDANPVINGKTFGAVLNINGDGANLNTIVRSGMFSGDQVSVTRGYYIGPDVSVSNATTTEVISSSGILTGVGIGARVGGNGSYKFHFKASQLIPESTSSYTDRVVLLIPIVSTNTIINNKINGKITASKTGGNVWDTFDISGQSVYNNTSASFDSRGQNETAKLVTLTYNGVNWLALRLPIVSNPYNNYWFEGFHYVESSLDPNGDAFKVLDYYNHQTTTVLNTEINNSISDYVINEIKTINGKLNAKTSIITPYIDIKTSNTRISSETGNYLRITTPSGYGDFGSANSSYFHMNTDRAKFYMDKPLNVDGRITVHNANSYIDATEGKIDNNIIYHAGNFGQTEIDGLSINADTLDGVDSTDFARTDQGNTFTGNNTFTNDVSANQVTWGNSSRNNGNPRSLAIGYSGANYGGFGYGLVFTGSSGSHTYAVNDKATWVEMNEGLQLHSAPTGTTGNAITWTELLDVKSSIFQYNNQDIYYAGNFGKTQIDALNINADTLDGLHSSSFSLTSHTHQQIIAVDDRDIKPNALDGLTDKQIRAYFTSLSGLNGASNSDYQDLLVMDTYSDATGGKINALAFDKSTKSIKLYQAATTDTVWGTPAELLHDGNFIAGTDYQVPVTTGIINALNIDAETLDGINSTTFARKDQSNTFTSNQTITSNTNTLFKTSTNGVGAGIDFTDISNNSQKGSITYFHTDTLSYGSGNSFVIGGTESTMTILADGKLMYSEGLYSKPGSGTGAGTRKDLNWDTAFGWGNWSTGVTKSFIDALNVDADTLDGLNSTGNPTANTITVRDGAADIHARLFRSNYATASSIPTSADIMMRTSTSDSYLRPINKTGFRTWLGKSNDSELLDGINSTTFARKDQAQTFTGVQTLATIQSSSISSATNQHLVLNAGESAGYPTGQTNEFVYVNAETGLQINASPDNWGTGWAGRITTTIDSSGINWNGNSVFHSSNIIGKSIPSVPNGTDLDSVITGIIATYSSTGHWSNAPVSMYGMIETKQGYAGANIWSQEAINIRHTQTNYSDKYIRAKNSTGWTGWSKVLHSNNFVAGSEYQVPVTKAIIDALNVDASTLNNKTNHVGSTSSVTGSTIVERASNGYIYGNYFHSQGLKSSVGASGIGGFAVRNTGNDGFIYGATLAEVQTALGLNSIDADTLDGINSTGFALAQGRVVTNANDAQFRVPGMYGFNGSPTNGTGESYGAMIVAANSDTGLQIAGGYSNDDLYFRGWASSGSTYYPWRKIYHSNNLTKAVIDALNVDADTLDGINSSSFIQTTGNQTFTGYKIHGASGTNRDSGVYGVYNASKFQHIWSMGTGYKISADGTSAGNLYGAAYKYNTLGGSVHAGGHQFVWANNGTIRVALGTNIWTAGSVIANGGTSSNWNTAYGWGNWATGVTKSFVDGLNVDADTLDGYNSTTSATANTIARRDSAGDISARLFRSEYDSTNSSVNYIMTQIDTASNNYIRPTTPAQFRTAVINPYFVDLSTNQSIGGAKTFTGIITFDDEIITDQLTANNITSSTITIDKSGTTGTQSELKFEVTNTTPGHSGFSGMYTYLEANYNSSMILYTQAGVDNVQSPGIRLSSDHTYFYKDLSMATGKKISFDGYGGMGIKGATNHLQIGDIGDSDKGVEMFSFGSNYATAGAGIKLDDAFIEFRSNTSVTMTLADDGFVGIGDSTPSYKLDVAGDIRATGNIISNSDRTLKTDIELISDPLDKLRKLRGVSFTWKSTKKKALGVIAQEVETVLPELVETDKEGIKSVNYIQMIGLLIESNKALLERIEKLESKI